MIAALLLGSKGSRRLPGKNTVPILIRHLTWYLMQTALAVSEIDRVYLSTDDPKLMQIADDLGVEIIERPEHLANDEALGEHVYVHG